MWQNDDPREANLKLFSLRFFSFISNANHDEQVVSVKPHESPVILTSFTCWDGLCSRTTVWGFEYVYVPSCSFVTDKMFPILCSFSYVLLPQSRLIISWSDSANPPPFSVSRWARARLSFWVLAQWPWRQQHWGCFCAWGRWTAPWVPSLN